MSYDSFPPNGSDRADGLDSRPGTPDTSGSLIVTGNQLDGGFFEEDPASPEIERGEQGTIQHVFNCDWTTGLTIINATGRGTIVTDSSGNVTRILSARLVHQRGNRATLSITAEGINFDTPPDEFDIETQEFNPDLLKHPRYKDLSDRQREVVRLAKDTTHFDSKGAYQGQIQGILGDIHLTPVEAYKQMTEAMEALTKLYRGEEVFYLVSFRLSYVQYFWAPPFIDPGGYLQDPAAVVPAYFMTTNQKEGGDNIFSLAPTINPALYSEGIQWLRQTDALSYQRTWFRLTRAWVGATLGHWDHDLYDRNPLTPYEKYLLNPAFP